MRIFAYPYRSRRARLTCTFSWIKMRHDGGFRARPVAGCRRMSQQADDLWSILFFSRRNRLCVCDVRPWKGIVELKGAEVAAATVAPTAKGAYGRPDPRVEADSIDFDVWAGSKETDLRRKAAENAHRQAQAGVAKFPVRSWRRCMVSQSFAMASPSPGILDSRERSATVQGPAMAYKRRLDDRGRSEKGIGPRGPSRSGCPCSPVATVVQRSLPVPARSRYDQ